MGTVAPPPQVGGGRRQDGTASAAAAAAAAVVVGDTRSRSPHRPSLQAAMLQGRTTAAAADAVGTASADADVRQRRPRRRHRNTLGCSRRPFFCGRCRASGSWMRSITKTRRNFPPSTVTPRPPLLLRGDYHPRGGGQGRPAGDVGLPFRGTSSRFRRRCCDRPGKAVASSSDWWRTRSSASRPRRHDASIGPRRRRCSAFGDVSRLLGGDRSKEREVPFKNDHREHTRRKGNIPCRAFSLYDSAELLASTPVSTRRRAYLKHVWRHTNRTCVGRGMAAGTRPVSKAPIF